MPPSSAPARRVALLGAAVLAAGLLLIMGWRLLAAPGPGAEALLVQPGEPVAGAEYESAGPISPGPSSTTEPPITVHVAGPVLRPGVVQLPAGARVADAVAACGGVLPGAEPGPINLARPLVDGERIDVAAADPVPTSAAAAPGGSALIDLNTADAARLQDLPGVGPVLAERIISYREEIGRFDDVGQLREVSGIGAARYADLSDQVTVGR